MIEHRDGGYYARANAHIELSNEQMQQALPGQVAASMIHATTRFNAWLIAATSQSAEDFESKRQKAMDAFLSDCRRQFETHFNDHVQNYDRLVVRNQQDAG